MATEPSNSMGLILLIGLSGTGKSTVGRLLANHLRVPFVDTDEEIERRSGRSIRRIFEESGESAFRAIEREVVASACLLTRGVVSTGGGAPLDDVSRAIMQRAGHILWLDAPIPTLAERLSSDGISRPLIAQNPQAALGRLQAERDPIYRSLGTHVDASGPPDTVLERVLDLVSASQPPTLRDPPIQVRTKSHAYPIFVGPGMIGQTSPLLEGAGLGGTLRVITDERVDAIHGRYLRAALAERSFSWHVMPAGEEYKTLAQADRMFDDILAVAPERGDVIVAFGGGVVGDLAGFVAATLLRGLRFAQIPTTVLSQVDSSVGGKVAVDHPRGKNLIGAFHQPSLVIADTDVLRTLPPREVAAGWAEVVKIAVIQDEPFFERLEQDADGMITLEPVATGRAIRRAIELKARLVEVDERDETGARAVLNYGHTIGHALEAVAGYGVLLHGEAVAIGMRAAAHIAVEMGLYPPDARARQEVLLQTLGLPDHCAGAALESVRQAIGFDKKRQDGKTTWILPLGLGHAGLRRDVPNALVDEAIALVTERTARQTDPS